MYKLLFFAIVLTLFNSCGFNKKQLEAEAHVIFESYVDSLENAAGLRAKFEKDSILKSKEAKIKADSLREAFIKDSLYKKKQEQIWLWKQKQKALEESSNKGVELTD